MIWRPWKIERSRGPEGPDPRLAARSLAGFGPVLGWGLFGWGLLTALGAALRSWPGLVGGTTSDRATAIVAFAARALGFGLMGWGAASACRLIAAIVLDRDEHARLKAERRAVMTERAAAALERAAAALEGMAAAGGPDADQRLEPRGTAAGRVESLLGIDQAIHEERWADADAMIARFVEEHSGDPAGPERRERLEAGRRASVEDRLAQLAAARQVNDPTRALALFLEIAPLLEAGPRHELERELSSWFLDVIQRRLRAVKIQPELVALASCVAETFRATVAGASLHAALPTLRRSVGLCPRCARPYRGMADACPECLSGPSDTESEV